MAYRLSRANAPFCRATTAPQLGFVLHALDQYDPAERSEAAQVFGLGAGVGVMAIVPNSPAAVAGLRAGDRLVSVNTLLLGQAAPAALPTDASVREARQILLSEMEKGAVVVRVVGPAGTRDVSFAAEAGCPATVELSPGTSVNAWADGDVVVIGGGLLARCATDEDLALVIAHELSHNLLHHSARLARAGVVKNGLLRADGPGSAEMRATEEEADALAVRLVAAAGFGLDHAAAFMGGLLTAADVDRPDFTHPAPARRLALLSAAIAHVRAPTIQVTVAPGR